MKTFTIAITNPTIDTHSIVLLPGYNFEASNSLNRNIAIDGDFKVNLPTRYDGIGEYTSVGVYGEGDKAIKNNRVYEITSGDLEPGTRLDPELGGDWTLEYSGYCTGTGLPKRIIEFFNVVKLSSVNLKKIKLSSDNEQQLFQSLNIEQLSPFGDMANDIMILSAYQDEHKFRNKILHIEKDILLTMNTRISIPLLANSNLYVTMEIDA
jgi:hypothetical protein